MNRIIYHIIDAASGHHAPNVIKNTLQYTERCEISPDLHRFVLHNFDADLNLGLKEAIKDLDADKIIYVKKKDGWSGLRKLLVGLSKEKAGILVHGINHYFLWFTLFTFSKKFLSRVVWICWGAGTTRSVSIKTRFTADIAKKAVLHKVKYVVVLLKKDKELLERHFKCKYVFVTPYMSQSIDFNSPIYQIKDTPKTVRNAVVRILIGNSAWETNNHHTIFDKLSPYKEERMDVLCPLSYGSADSTYADSVMKVGKKMFGERFFPITQLLPTKDYMELIYSVDVIVIYSDRQMALFALYAGVNLGKKIVLKRSGANFDWFSSLGIKVFDFDDFPSFDSFVQPLSQEDKLHNKLALTKLANFDVLAQNWKFIYKMLTVNENSI
ncbi:MAG: hypothetical protein EAS52_01470 [Parapedobacter sp.]|nr:MAG: hypothetical protein EAS52_01470 [Parapedobacter sp.]